MTQCTAGKLSEDSLIDSNLFWGFAALAADGRVLALVLRALSVTVNETLLMGLRILDLC